MKLALLAIFAVALVLSCSDLGRDNPLDPKSWKYDPSLAQGAKITKEKITGFSQKGPFIVNSSVTLQELDARLSQTGNLFQGLTDASGGFEINGITLASPYALLKAEGYYRNEVTGGNSEQITLYAIADITDKSSVNVNILTHLEYHRVLSLVEQGKSLREAKQQALGEILAVFGIGAGAAAKGSEDMSIFGTGDGDAALLAISVLLQGGLGAGDFSALLGSFSQGFKVSGVWEDEAGKAAVKAWACTADLAAIRSNVLAWGISASVPNFEKYVTAYCGTQSSSSSIQSSSSGTALQQCGIYTYNPGTQFCQDGSTPVTLCGGKTFESWQFCTVDGNIYDKCNGNGYNPTTHYCLDGKTYSCGNKPYNPSAQFCYNSSKVGNLCGARTEIFDPDLYECRESSKIYLKTPVSYQEENYEAVLIGSQTWMAKNLNYNITGSKCYAEGVSGVSTDSITKNCTKYGRLYNWATAMANSASSNANPSGVRGICPQGWHIPSNAEWNVLAKTVNPSCSDNSHCSGAGTKLKASSEWNSSSGISPGSDDYGFAALPGGQYESTSFSGVGEGTRWWSSSENTNNTSNALFRSMIWSNEDLRWFDTFNKSLLHSIRCVKN